MTQAINTNSIIQRNDDLVQAEIDGETVIMSIDNGEYYGLDIIASHIWKIIETPLMISVICEKLAAEYDVTEETCLSDVLIFLNDMAEHNIVSVSA